MSKIVKSITIPLTKLEATTAFLHKHGYIFQGKNNIYFPSTIPAEEKSYTISWEINHLTENIEFGKRKLKFHTGTPDEFIAELALRFL